MVQRKKNMFLFDMVNVMLQVLACVTLYKWNFIFCLQILK